MGSIPARPPTERIEDGDAGGFEIRYVTRYYGEPVFQRRGRDHEIGAVIAERCAQGTPAPRRWQIERHDPLAVEDQYPIQPGRKRVGKAWISRALSCNAALYFSNADDAEEQFGRSLPFEPRHDHWIAFPPAQLGQRDGIDQEHQSSGSRIRTLRRENSPSSCGMASSTSAKEGARARSRRRRSSYSTTSTTTTAGLPCLVTVCGARRAASTTSLKRFFASCTDQLRWAIGLIFAS